MTRSGTRVCVVGAGLAGLHCTYQLREAGVMATLYEASSRTGGRTFSLAGQFSHDHVAELGAELINSDHSTMLHLAHRFGLQLDDLAGAASSVEYPGYLFSGEGRGYSDREIAEAFAEQLAPRIEDLFDSLAGPNGPTDMDNASARRFDARNNLEQWLENTGADRWLVALIQGAFCAEYGREAAEQSVFNFLFEYADMYSTAQRKLRNLTEPGDVFRLLAASDERYRLHRGNQGIADKLQQALAHHIHTDRPLLAIRQTAEGLRLTFAKGAGGTEEVAADQVVLAMPFSTLRAVDLSGVRLSVHKRAFIHSCTYGTSAKLMGQLSSPVWHKQQRSGAVMVAADGSASPMQQGWDTSRLQPGHPNSPAIFTHFIGGKPGAELGQGTAEEQWQGRLSKLDELFPGSRTSYASQSAVRMHWPSQRWTLGSYLCLGPGHWHTSSIAAKQEGRIHFCGEHTAGEYQGFMEGAARSGARAAREVLSDLAMSAAVAALDSELPHLQ